jgi:hypothetical protein
MTFFISPPNISFCSAKIIPSDRYHGHRWGILTSRAPLSRQTVPVMKKFAPWLFAVAFLFWIGTAIA